MAKKRNTNVIQLNKNITSTMNLSDEQIEFWGDIYIAASIQERTGVPFIVFLNHPYRFLLPCGRECAPAIQDDDLRRRLPRQEAHKKK